MTVEAQVEVESSTCGHVLPVIWTSHRRLSTPFLHPPSEFYCTRHHPHFMPRSQRPKQGKATSVGKTATLRSFFGPASKPGRTPSKQMEIIIIDSDDESVEPGPTQSKRKASNDSDAGGSPGLKKGKLSRHSARPAVPENDSPLKSVPSSSLNRNIGTIEADMYTQSTQTEQMITIVGDWETGDDELLDLIDDSQAFGGDDGSENILNTCPICGAIFVDFCLSVSVASPSLMSPC